VDKKAAFVGESGRKNQMTKAQRQVTPPSYREERKQVISFLVEGNIAEGVTYDVEEQLPTLGCHIFGELRDAHGDVGSDLRRAI
jgi:hypothetical protein